MLLLPVLTACSSTPAGKPVKDPAIEAAAKREREEQKAILARQRSMPLVLTRLDQALSEYVAKVSQSENARARKQADALRGYLEFQSKRFVKELLAKLGDEDVPRNRSIAAGALGFTGSEDVVAPLLNAVADPVDYVRANACLGLGTLALPLTPLDGLTRLCLDSEQPIQVRRAASWALLRLQEAVGRKAAPETGKSARLRHFAEVWSTALEGDPLAKDSVIVIHALRGIGLLRDPAMVDPVLRYLSHPKPFVRQAALIAAARCRNRKAVPLILPFLSPAESNPNVRLTARKALKALAGGRIDHEYDLGAWKQEFDVDKNEGR